MKTLSRIVLALALAVSFTAFAGETGSVSGTVKDGTGAGVPGASVKIAGPQMPAGRTVVTTSGGAFNFQRLLPGNYTVEAELQGLGKASRKVAVSVDNDVQVELSLIQTAKGEVVVTASLAEVDKKSTEVNANFASTEIRQLPLPRTYEGLLNLIPGAPAVDSGGYVSIAGGTRQDNKYLIDGVNITNPSYGYLGIDTNELDIADVNVKRGGISAEFGRTSGAVVNAVTKSGTNELKGDVRIAIQPASFRADNNQGVIQRDVDQYVGAAGLGFPIVKDILFGYVSGRYSSTTTSGQSATIGGVTTTQPDTKTKNQDYFGKVTAFLGQSVLLNAGFRAMPNKTDDGFDSAYDLLSAAWNSDNTNYVGNFTADWFATKNTYLEAKYIHMEENNNYGAANALTDRPMTIDPNHPEKYGAFYDSTRLGGNTGVYYVTNGAENYKRDEVRLTASQFLDIGPTQNQFKIGGGAEFDDHLFIRTSNGWGTLIKGSTCPASVCGTSKSGNVRARYYNLQPEQTGKARTYSAFLQDTLTWGRLSANLGVLFNYDDFAQVALNGTRYNFMTFRWGDEVQPRLGVVYNTELIKGDKVYTNYGEYTGLDQKSTTRSFAPFRIREDQAWFDKTTGAFLGQQIRGSSSGKYIPPDLKAPYNQEWVIGYSAPLMKDIAFDLFYQYRNLKTPFEDTPINPDNYFGLFQAKTFYNARHVYRGVTLDVTKRYSNGWYANVNYTYSKLYGNWDDDYLEGQYNTSSYLEDEPGWNSADPNRYGRLGQDRPHILKIMGSYDIFGFTLGGFLRVQSGTPWEARGYTPSGVSGRYLEPAGTHRLPTWTNFDFLLAYGFDLGSGFNLRLEGRIQNLFNTQTVLGVDDLKYLDDYVDGDPARNLGPQGTTQPNSLYGTPYSWATPRRFVVTALLNF